MTLRRMFIGLGVVMALSVWALARTDDKPGPTQTDEPPIAAPSDRGNYDEATHHYRSGHSRHWRQVMVGSGY